MPSTGRRGGGAGAVNAKYGPEPGLRIYTHLSDMHGSFHTRVLSATSSEAPYVLDGLIGRGGLGRCVVHGDQIGHYRHITVEMLMMAGPITTTNRAAGTVTVAAAVVVANASSVTENYAWSFWIS